MRKSRVLSAMLAVLLVFSLLPAMTIIASSDPVNYILTTDGIKYALDFSDYNGATSHSIVGAGCEGNDLYELCNRAYYDSDSYTYRINSAKGVGGIPSADIAGIVIHDTSANISNPITVIGNNFLSYFFLQS